MKSILTKTELKFFKESINGDVLSISTERAEELLQQAQELLKEGFAVVNMMEQQGINESPDWVLFQIPTPLKLERKWENEKTKDEMGYEEE